MPIYSVINTLQTPYLQGILHFGIKDRKDVFETVVQMNAIKPFQHRTPMI